MQECYGEVVRVLGNWGLLMNLALSLLVFPKVLFIATFTVINFYQFNRNFENIVVYKSEVMWNECKSCELQNQPDI